MTASAIGYFSSLPLLINRLRYWKSPLTEYRSQQTGIRRMQSFLYFLRRYTPGRVCLHHQNHTIAETAQQSCLTTRSSRRTIEHREVVGVAQFGQPLTEPGSGPTFVDFRLKDIFL